MRKVGIIFLMISVIGFLGASTRFCGRSSSIRIGETSTVDLNTNMTIDEGTIRIDTGGNITGDGGVYANFSQGVLEYHDFETYFTGRLDPDEATHEVLLSTNGDIVRAEPGTVIDGIQIDAGISATILGQPIMDDTILLNDGATVFLGLQSKLNTTVSMNATDAAWVSVNAWTAVVLEDDLMLKDHVILDHKGTVSFNGHRIVTGGEDLTWSASDQLWYNAADFSLGGDLTLGATIVFDGSSTATSYIYGNKHTLNMNDKCLFVSRNTTLVMENLIINGLHGKASGGASSAGSIALDEGAFIAFKNVTILMDTSNPYEFDRGTLYVISGGELKILPGGSTAQNFEYSTNATELSIQSNAKLIVGRRATFEYDSSAGTGISFADDSSEIFIENGTFTAAQSWTLAVGTMVVDGKSTIATSGNTVTVADTADIVIMPGATMLISGAGTVHYGAAYVPPTLEWPDTEDESRMLSSPQDFDYFGISVAIDGDYAIVGAYGVDTGAAYIYERSGSTWPATPTKTLTAPNGGGFGSAVAISGDYAIVGAYAASSVKGQAYIYERDTETGWPPSPTQTLTGSITNEQFGYSVGITEDGYAIVGVPAYSSMRGRAYIYTRGGGGSWTTEGAIYRPAAASNDSFGHSVAISGTYAIVGAAGASSYDGEVHIYEYDSGWPTTADKVISGPSSAGAYFGGSVAINGTYAIVGAKSYSSSQGRAYIYERGSGDWSSETAVYLSSRDNFDRFGCSVAISGDYAIVGAKEDNSDEGTANIFERSGGTWPTNPTKTIAASVAAAEDYFGISVGISGTTAIVGASGFSTSKGKIYLFEKD